MNQSLTINLDLIFKKSDFIFSKLKSDGKIMILDAVDPSNKIFLVDGLAALVWEAIDGVRSLDQIVITISEQKKFSTLTQQKFKQDTLELAAQLINMGFIKCD